LFEYHSGKIKIIGKNEDFMIDYHSSLLHIKLRALANT